jgi:hypothetical protein
MKLILLGNSNKWTEPTKLTTPVVLDAGYSLDPRAILLHAKQLGDSLARNVEVHIIIQRKLEVHYYFRYSAEKCAVEVIDVCVFQQTEVPEEIQN